MATKNIALAHMRPHRGAVCPYCGAGQIRKVHRRGIIEQHLFKVFNLCPHRCIECYQRFYARPTEIE
jgi:hypothetical protein